MAEPFRSSFGTFGSFGSFGSPAEELTPLQALQLQFAQNKPSGGLLNKIFGGARKGLTELLHFITRPAYAVAEGTRAGLEGQGFDISDALQGAARGIKGEVHTGFGQVLEQEGVLLGHRKLRGLLGLALDIGTDPLLPLVIGTGPIGIGAKASVLAAKGLSRGAVAKASKIAVDHTVTDPRIWTEAKTVLRGAGEGFEQQAAFLEAKIAAHFKGGLNEAENRAMHALAAGAREERIRSLGGNYLNLQYKIPFGPRLVSPALPKRAPSLTRFSTESRLLNIPGLRALPKSAELLARAFKPGWDEPKFHAIRMVGKRIYQDLSDEQVRTFDKLLRPFVFGKNALNDDELFHTLHVGETTRGIVRDTRNRDINRRTLNRLVKRGDLTQRQADFLKAWHNYTEVLRKQDLEYGFTYKNPPGGVIYVPHFYGKDGTQILGQKGARSLLAQPGFTYTRLSKRPHSVEQLYELYKKGVYKDALETHPVRLAIIRGRRGAQAHAEEVMRKVVAASYGVATKIPNEDKFLEAAFKAHRLGERLNKLELLKPKNLDKIRLGKNIVAAREYSEKAAKIKATYRTKRRKAQARLRQLKSELDAIENKRYLTEGKKVVRTYQLFGITPSQAKGLLKGQITRQENLVKKYTSDMNRELENLIEKTAQRREYFESKIQERYESQLAQGDRIRTRIQQEEAKMERYRTSTKRNPDVYGNNDLVPESRLKNEEGIPLAIPADISASLHKVEQAIRSDKFLQEFANVWDKNVGRWKILATVVNPGYRVRNTISDMWNMFVRGVPLWAINKYGILAARRMYVALKKGDPEAIREFKEAFDHGIFAGLFQGDVDRVIQHLRYERPSARSPRFIRAYGRIMMNFNRNAENWGRYTHYLYARKHLKMSPEDAAARVRETHFDYEDLTPFEQSIKRNLAPFYTWTRKNIPFQITSMLARPGRYATFNKLINESEYVASGEGPAGLTPQWLEQSLAFRAPIGGPNTYFIPDFGPADLTNITRPQNLTGLLGPFIKAPFELAFNKSLFTGAPIHGNERTHPLEPVSRPIGAIANLLGLGGTTERTVDGQQVSGPGAHPILAYLANLAPPAGFATTRMSDIRSAQRGGYTPSLLSYFGGLGTYSPDQKQTEEGLYQEFLKSFRSYVRGLRDENQLPEPDEREDSPFTQQLRGILKSQAKIY